MDSVVKMFLLLVTVILTGFGGVKAHVGNRYNHIENPAVGGDTLPITIQELRRHLLEDGNTQYVIRYVKNAERIISTAVIGKSRYIRPDIYVIDGQLEEAQLTINESDAMGIDIQLGSISVVFQEENRRTGLVISLGRPSSNGDTGQTDYTDRDVSVTADDFEVPYFSISPPRELVYEEGQNVEVSFTAVETEGNPLSRDEFFVIPFLYNLDTRQFLEMYESLHEFYTLSDMIDAPEGKEFEATVLTSQGRVSGFVDISRTSWDSVSILKSITISRLLEIRPAAQAGPYPENVIGFLVSSFTRDENGVEINRCDADTGGCSTQCVALGNDISDVTMERILPNGETVPVLTTGSWQFYYPYIRLVGADIANPPPDEVGDPQRYRCTANSLDGSTATKEVLVQFYREIKILETGTSAHLTQDGSNHTLRLECTAEGIPEPRITFTLGFSNAYMSGQGPDEISTSDDGQQVTGVITITWDTAVGRNLLSAGCNADSRVSGYDYYEYSLPHVDVTTRSYFDNSMYKDFIV